MRKKFTPHAVCIAIVVALAPTVNADEKSQTYSPERLVERIVSDNPEIQYYEAEIAKASGAVINAQKLQNPELIVDLGRKEASESGHNLGQGLAWGVSYAQTFEYPGRIKLREAIAKKQSKLAELQLAKFKLALRSRAKNQVLDLYLAQQNRQSVEEIARKAKSLVSVLSKREIAGPALLLERKIIEASALSLKQRAIQLAGDVEKLSVELNALGGFDMASRYSIGISSIHKSPLIPDSEALVALALENNPDVVVKKTELLQQGYRVKLSEHEKNPSFTVRPFYSEEDAGELERTVGVGFSVPLPIWNDNSGNIAIERAQASQVEASLKALQREISGKVTGSYASYKLQTDQITALGSSSVDSLRESAQEAEKQYELGVIPVSTYLQLQEQYLENIDLYRSSKVQILKIVAELEELTGQSIQAEN